MSKFTRGIILEIVLLILIMTLSEGMFISVISVVLHEISHILVGWFYGCKLHGVKIRLTGLSAELSELNELKDFQKLNLYLVGPMVNLLIFLICFCLNKGINNEHIVLIGDINLGLFIFNMIPTYPLDGGRILEIILSKCMTYRMAKGVIRKISHVFVGFLFLIFITEIIKGRFQIGLILVGILILYATYIEKKTVSYIMMDNLFKKGRLLEKYEYIENRSISVINRVKLLNVLKMIDKNKFNIFYVLDDELKVLGIVNEDELIEALKSYGNISLNEYLILKKRNTI